MIRRFKQLLLKFLLMFSFVTAVNLILTGCYPMQIQSDNSGNSYNSPRDYNIDELNQYGQWINIPDYGQVWKPSVVDGWEPYYNGHWIYSDDSWTWVSYEPFGWIVYHYGNWFNDPDNGWVWIPGNNGWSPANVQWYQYDDYVSWAPLPPRGVSYREPWDEKDYRYWHTVNEKVFLNDDVGHFQEAHPITRINGGQRPSSAPPSSPRNQGGNQGINTPSVSRPNIQTESPPPVRPKEMAGDRISVPKSPAPENIQQRTGQKVTNLTVPRVQQNTNSNSKLQKMNLPDRERQRVDSHQQEIKKNVLVPNRPQAPRPAPAKKDDKKP
jgi:hypothetical protein